MSVINGSFNALSMVKVERTALVSALVTAGKETNDKTCEEFQHIEEIASEQKEKTCTYACPSVNRG